MSQTVVPKFYSTRKRFKDSVKTTENVQKEKLSEVQDVSEKTIICNSKKSVQKTSRAKSKGKNANKITNYLKSEPETSKCISEKDVQRKIETPLTPKRNLKPDETTPSKRKLLNTQETGLSQESSPIKPSVLLTPKKQDTLARKKLLVGSPSRYGSPRKYGSPQKSQLSPQKAAEYDNLSNKDLASLVEQSRTKVLFSGRLDELKKSLESFTNVAAKTKDFQANSCKITSVISSAKKSDVERTPVIKGEPAYKKYSYLAAPKSETSFVLPYKYKLLGETFRCLDTVVKMIYNRKEKITFDKVKVGVQEMMKKNFLLNHLGQIMTVFPKAYTLEYEKCDSYTINSKGSSPYQLIITPNLAEDGNSPEAASKEKKNNHSFIYMTPQHLLERKYIFEQSLIKITKVHHQEFLKRKKFPVVSDEKIVRWHPEFPVDFVPNISVAALPEEPESKVCTAKDVLSKIKGSFRGRVEKALQSVADERELKEKITPESDAKQDSNKKQNSALKGICSDLLAKIRARESAKIIETMTRSTQDEKRLAMMERVPKIVHILWHYFIAERKAAVPVDVAVDKIIHSFNSLTTPDAVKEHLELIRETMPGWLSVIKIPKGEYITIDKKKDINVMLDNIK